MNGENFNAEPPPEFLNFLEEELCEDNYNILQDESELFHVDNYVVTDNKTSCLPRSIKEHLIIEYTAIFVNVEGDVAEFYLKMSNVLLKKFPFIHIDHPLHEYYEFIKKYPKKRVCSRFPHLTPNPLKALFDYVSEIEKNKIYSNETTEKVLREKQINNLKEKKKRKKEGEQEDQSYATLFMKYMESDEESENEDKKDKEQKKETENKSLCADTKEKLNIIIKKINDLNNDSVNSYVQLLLKYIDSLPFLQFGSAEYHYFKNELLKKNSSSGEEFEATSEEFLRFLEKMSIHSKPLEERSNNHGPTHKKEQDETEDKLKTIQNFRREKAKMLFYGLKKN